MFQSLQDGIIFALTDFQVCFHLNVWDTVFDIQLLKTITRRNIIFLGGYSAFWWFISNSLQIWFLRRSKQYLRHFVEDEVGHTFSYDFLSRVQKSDWMFRIYDKIIIGWLLA